MLITLLLKPNKIIWLSKVSHLCIEFEILISFKKSCLKLIEIFKTVFNHSL
jgi:hypothetical protein